MNAGQYKAELAMSRLVSKYLQSRVGYWCKFRSPFHSLFHHTSRFSSPA